MTAFRLAEMEGEPDVDALMERTPYRVLRKWQTWWGLQADELEAAREEDKHKRRADDLAKGATTA